MLNQYRNSNRILDGWFVSSTVLPSEASPTLAAFRDPKGFLQARPVIRVTLRHVQSSPAASWSSLRAVQVRPHAARIHRDLADLHIPNLNALIVHIIFPLRRYSTEVDSAHVGTHSTTSRAPTSPTRSLYRYLPLVITAWYHPGDIRL
jgi:hypothetical protein